jgi:hypothetical protein
MRPAIAWVLLLFPFLACSDATEVPEVQRCGEARSLDPSLRLPPVTGTLTIDDQWAAIARQVPGGWGGIFLINGRGTMYLVHPEQLKDAIAALTALGFDVRISNVVRARWDFAQLYDWYRYINVQAWQVAGFHDSGIDEMQNRLFYGVDSSAVSRFKDLLQSLDLPCDLVTVEATAGSELR